jgi:hypothetical protein
MNYNWEGPYTFKYEYTYHRVFLDMENEILSYTRDVSQFTFTPPLSFELLKIDHPDFLELVLRAREVSIDLQLNRNIDTKCKLCSRNLHIAEKCYWCGTQN